MNAGPVHDIGLPQPVLGPLPARRPRPTLTLGIVGGGQLARMLSQAALQLGCEVAVLERNSQSPAAALTAHQVIGDWDNPESLLKLGALADVVTLENEFVEAASLAVLEQFGHPLRPSAATVRVVQDKLTQKQAFAAAGLPVPRFAPAPDRAAIAMAGCAFGWPLLLKQRRNGYDGKGNVTVRSASEIDAAWQRLCGDDNALYVEQFCPFVSELAIMITRARDGTSVSYPLVETIQRDHICHTVKVPAATPPPVAEQAAEIARRAVNVVGGMGSMGVELFLTREGHILINEIAPRVHNSGHYTIEACTCSQFENHVRAVLGWPLGDTSLVSPAAVMVNLLGSGKGPGAPHGMAEALAVPGAHIHVYGKALSARGRKMGHITALGQTVEQALATAQKAAAAIRFGDLS